MEWIFCNKIADMSVSYFGISGGSRDVRASLTVRKVCSRGGSSSSPRLWPADTSAGHFLKKQPPQEIILHTALLFTDGWLSLLPALPLLICQLSEGLAGRTEEGWSGPVKVEGSTEARSVCVCRRQAERLPRFSPGAPTALSERLSPPRRPWAAAYGNWKTRRTAAPGRSTPPWRDHKWRPRRTLCTSMCCWTSVWKVGCLLSTNMSHYPAASLFRFEWVGSDLVLDCWNSSGAEMMNWLIIQLKSNRQQFLGRVW